MPRPVHSEIPAEDAGDMGFTSYFKDTEGNIHCPWERKGDNSRQFDEDAPDDL